MTDEELAYLEFLMSIGIPQDEAFMLLAEMGGLSPDAMGSDFLDAPEESTSGTAFTGVGGTTPDPFAQPVDRPGFLRGGPTPRVYGMPNPASTGTRGGQQTGQFADWPSPLGVIQGLVGDYNQNLPVGNNGSPEMGAFLSQMDRGVGNPNRPHGYAHITTPAMIPEYGFPGFDNPNAPYTQAGVGVGQPMGAPGRSRRSDGRRSDFGADEETSGDQGTGEGKERVGMGGGKGNGIAEVIKALISGGRAAVEPSVRGRSAQAPGQMKQAAGVQSARQFTPAGPKPPAATRSQAPAPAQQARQQAPRPATPPTTTPSRGTALTQAGIRTRGR